MTNIVALIAATVLNLTNSSYTCEIEWSSNRLGDNWTDTNEHKPSALKSKSAWRGYGLFLRHYAPHESYESGDTLGSWKVENADALFFLSIHQKNNDNLKKLFKQRKALIKSGMRAAKNWIRWNSRRWKLMKEGFNALKNKVDSGDMHYANSLGLCLWIWNRYFTKYQRGNVRNTIEAAHENVHSSDRWNVTKDEP